MQQAYVLRIHPYKSSRFLFNYTGDRSKIATGFSVKLPACGTDEVLHSLVSETLQMGKDSERRSCLSMARLKPCGLDMYQILPRIRFEEARILEACIILGRYTCTKSGRLMSQSAKHTVTCQRAVLLS